MTHRAIQIRDRIVALVSAIPAYASSVHKSYAYDLERLGLPAIVVQMGDEISEPSSMPSPRMMQREQDYHVIAAAENNADSDGAVMAIALDIEKALAMPASNSGLWTSLTLRESRVLRDGTGTKVTGQRVLIYRASYFARENAPDA